MTLVDSNVWIFLNIETAPEHPAACRKIDQLSETGLQINDIIVSEVFHKLGRLPTPSEGFNGFWRPGTSCTNRSGWGSLARPCRWRSGIAYASMNDAIIAARALDLGTDLLTDNVETSRASEI